MSHRNPILEECYDPVQVLSYYEYRAEQLAPYGYEWRGTIFWLCRGIIYTSFKKDGKVYYSGYIMAQYRGLGLSKHLATFLEDKTVVTLEDCNIESWLKKNNIDYVVEK